jgi:hypothetical protein
MITGCKEPVMDTYSPDQLTEISVESVSEDTVKIVFNTMLETLYYCPGLNVSEKDNKILLDFIRCSIKEKCPVTHEAQQGEGGSYFVLVKNDGNPILIQYKNGEKKIYPQ